MMPGPQAKSPLSQMRAAAPCQQSWDTMSGNDQVRFCSQCYKKVYKFSNLNRAQAIDLVTAHEGRACVAYYRRADGSVMAEECPVGLRRVQRPFHFARMTATALLLPLLGFTSLLGISKLTGAPTRAADGGDDLVVSLRAWQPFTTIAEILDPTPPVEDMALNSPIDQFAVPEGLYPAPALLPPAMRIAHTVAPITPGYRINLRKAPVVPPTHPVAPPGKVAPPRQNLGHIAP